MKVILFVLIVLTIVILLSISDTIGYVVNMPSIGLVSLIGITTYVQLQLIEIFADVAINTQNTSRLLEKFLNK